MCFVTHTGTAGVAQLDVWGHSLLYKIPEQGIVGQRCATVCAVPAAGPPGCALLIVYKFHDVCVCVCVRVC